MKIVLMICFMVVLAASSWAAVDVADIHLDFEGDIGGLGAACWANKGTAGTGESTSRAGTDTPLPFVAPGSLKGQGWDSTDLSVLTSESSYMYGEFSTDTAMEQALIDVQSFTYTTWVKTETANTANLQGRLLYTRAFEFNYIQGNIGQVNQYGRLAIRIGGSSYLNTNNDYESPDEWVFIALTYDGTKSADNLLCYVGNETTPVSLSTTLTADQGLLGRIDPGGNLWMGNVGNYQSGNRPYVGFMDEMRLYTSHDDASGVLDATALEEIRQFDLVPEPMTLALLGLGAFFVRRR